MAARARQAQIALNTVHSPEVLVFNHLLQEQPFIMLVAVAPVLLAQGMQQVDQVVAVQVEITLLAHQPLEQLTLAVAVAEELAQEALQLLALEDLA